jgi:uncharacterized protein YggE
MMKPVLAGLALLCSVGLASANITVVGNGKVKYTPDIGTITAGVTSEGATAAEAWQKNGEVVKKLFEVLKQNGIDAKDMKTVNLNVAPKYVHEKDKDPVLVGYTASYDLNVTVRKLDDMGKVLDGLAENGANRHMSISFGCSELDKLLDEAKAKAAAAARHDAEILAANAGGSLGVVLEISQGVNYVPYRLEFERQAAMADKALPIAPGEQETSVQVTVTYALNPLPAHS